MRTSGTDNGWRRGLDAALIDRSLGGDRAASRELHREYAPIVAAFLRRRGVRPDEIEDACQEVFLQFFRYLAGFRGEAELKTWLFRLCITEARRVRRRRKLGVALAALLQREPTTRAVPPALRSEATIRALVAQALDRMQPEQRQAFILFGVQGLTGKEAAQREGRSLPSTFRRLYEARRVFQQTLGIEAPRPG